MIKIRSSPQKETGDSSTCHQGTTLQLCWALALSPASVALGVVAEVAQGACVRGAPWGRRARLCLTSPGDKIGTAWIHGTHLSWLKVIQDLKTLFQYLSHMQLGPCIAKLSAEYANLESRSV